MSELFNSKSWKIIIKILSEPEKTIHVRNTAKKLDVTSGMVSITLKKLQRLGIVKKSKVDLTNPKTRSLKILFNTLVICPLINKIREIPGAKGIGVYGSWANGTNTKSSDIDIWIKIKKYPAAVTIARLRANIRKKLGVEPSLLFLTEKRVQDLRKNNPPLYFSLYHSLLLWGENLG